MKSRDKQLRRLILFIDEVKKGRYPNANTFSTKLSKESENAKEDLNCSSKTIKRDIEYLKSYYNAPLEYDPSERGYMLYIADWNLPGIALSGDEVFAELFNRKISQNSLLPCLKEHLETGDEIQLTVSDDEKFSQSILGSVICATGKIAKINEDVSQDIIHAWKECATIKAHYKKSSRLDAEARTLDIHALFLSDNIWYCRAYCHMRQDFRNFSLHKFTKVTSTENHFKRSAQVVQNLKKGSLFNYKNISKVSATCSVKVADYINDREWFPEQKTHFLENDALQIEFTNVPKLAIKSWVSSFNGEVKILTPESLKQEIYTAAKKLMEEHRLQ